MQVTPAFLGWPVTNLEGAWALESLNLKGKNIGYQFTIIWSHSALVFENKDLVMICDIGSLRGCIKLKHLKIFSFKIDVYGVKYFTSCITTAGSLGAVFKPI